MKKEITRADKKEARFDSFLRLYGYYEKTKRIKRERKEEDLKEEASEAVNKKREEEDIELEKECSIVCKQHDEAMALRVTKRTPREPMAPKRTRVKIIETKKYEILGEVNENGDDSADLLALEHGHEIDKRSGAFLMKREEFDAYVAWLDDLKEAEALEGQVLGQYGEDFQVYMDNGYEKAKENKTDMQEYPKMIRELVNSFVRGKAK